MGMDAQEGCEPGKLPGMMRSRQFDLLEGVIFESSFGEGFGALALCQPATRERNCQPKTMLLGAVVAVVVVLKVSYSGTSQLQRPHYRSLPLQHSQVPLYTKNPATFLDCNGLTAKTFTTPSCPPQIHKHPLAAPRPNAAVAAHSYGKPTMLVTFIAALSTGDDP